MSDDHPVRLIAITGGSGSGKTRLADGLRRVVGRRAGRLSQDSFYRDWSHLQPAARDKINFDHPNALDWAHFEDALQTLRRGRACLLPVYDFETHRRRPEGEILHPRPIMFVDGLWLLHRPEVRRHFELSIFIHCDEDERLRRRIARDTVERGRTADSVMVQFRETVAPMHRQFISPQAAHADLLLHQPCREMEILQLQERLTRLLPLGPALNLLFTPENCAEVSATGVLTS
jgi:uridine kinase